MIGYSPLDLRIQVDTRDLPHSIYNLTADSFCFGLHILIQIVPVAVLVVVKVDQEIEGLLEYCVDERISADG
ncbi:MAG: hypothetical protein Q7U39_02420 [Nitrospira sp.]|nr:hypothetical protein [Nitrospira sp.]